MVFNRVSGMMYVVSLYKCNIAHLKGFSEIALHFLCFLLLFRPTCSGVRCPYSYLVVQGVVVTVLRSIYLVGIFKAAKKAIVDVRHQSGGFLVQHLVTGAA